MSGEVLPGLRLSAAYAFTDARVTQDNNTFLVGRQSANVPRHSANLMLVKSLPIAGNAASFGGGLNYIGEREGAVAPLVTADNFKLPAYTSVKPVSSYNVNKQLQLSLDIDNLLDKTVYTSSYNQVWVFPGSGRKFTLTARNSEPAQGPAMPSSSNMTQRLPRAAPASAVQCAASVHRQRITSIDALRGLVMVIMMLHHVRETFFLHLQVTDPMTVPGTPADVLFSRLAAHICAPVFVFLTGLGAWLYANPPNGTPRPVAGFLLKRGLLLIVLELTLVNLAWSGHLRRAVPAGDVGHRLRHDRAGTAVGLANGMQTAMSWLNFTKYPPSLDFLLLTLSIGMLVLATLERVDNAATRALSTFGGAPMFYYLLHLYVLLVGYRILFAVIGPNQGTRFGVDADAFWIVWVVWLGMVPLLYIPVSAFARYKRRSTRAWVRYF